METNKQQQNQQQQQKIDSQQQQQQQQDQNTINNNVNKTKQSFNYKVTMEESDSIRSRNETQAQFSMDNSSASTQSYLELNLKRRSAQQILEKEFSFEKFTSGDIRNISITVLGMESKLFKYKAYKIEVKSPFFPDLLCFRRYNEFQALYKVLKLKYQNIQLPNFPSKYTIMNRIEKRRVAFHRILNGILEIAQQHHGLIQKNILQLLYVFLTKDLSGKQANKVEIGQQINNYSMTQSSSFDDGDTSYANIIGLEHYGEEFKGMNIQLDEEEEYIDEENINLSSHSNGNNINNNSIENENKTNSIPNSITQSPVQQIRQEKSLSIENSSQEIKKRQIDQSYTNNNKRPSLPVEVAQTIQNRIAKSSMVTHRKSSDSIDNNLLLGNSAGSQDNNSNSNANNNSNKVYQPVIIQNIVHHNNDKEEKDFCGYIKVCLQNDQKKVLYGRIVNNSLQLFQHIFDNHFSCLISIFEAKIQYHPQNSHIIEIFHDYDSKKIQLSLENDNTDSFYLNKDDPVQDINAYIQDLLKRQDKKSFITDDNTNDKSHLYNEKYIPPRELQKWLSQLKFATQKRQDINLNDFVFEPIGKIYLSIHEITNYKNILPNSTVFIRIKSSPFTFQTKENISDSPKWKQDFIFPFSSSYGIITLEVVSVNNKGWIKENFIEKVLSSTDIQIADILGHNQDTIFRKISLELENTDQRTKYLTKQGVKDIESQQMSIILSLRNLSKFESIFAESSYNIYDGVKMSEQKKSIFKYYKINFTRYKRLSGNIFLFIWSINDIFYQKYPQFSKLMMGFFLLYIGYANLNNILLHLLALLLFIIIINNPKIYPYYLFFTNKYLFTEKHPYYHEPQIYTKKMNEYIKMSQCLSKIQKLNKDIVVQEQIQLTLSQTYQYLKKSFFLLHEWISIMVNYCEKFKNLLTWKDQNRTHQFFIFLIFLYIIFTHFPLRYILFCGCIYNYIIGYNVYEKRYKINQNQGKNLIIYVYKKYWADQYKNWEQIANLKYPNEQIKKMVKQAQNNLFYFYIFHYFNNSNYFFYKKNEKLIEEGLVHFYLWITEEQLTQHDTPQKLMDAIATVPKKLFMNKVEGPHQATQIYKELQQESKLKLSKYLTTVKTWKNFLYNIPSDCYRILHPKMI